MKKGKVAINISGVSRYLNESYQNIKDMIIQPLEEYGYEVDLFIHTWQIIGLVDDKWGFNIDNMRFTEDDWKKSKLWYEKNKSIRNSEIKKNINGIVGGWVRRLEVENHKQAMVKMNETIVNGLTPHRSCIQSIKPDYYSRSGKLRISLHMMWL